MSEVIEHVENPDQFVRAAAEVLKVLTTSNIIKKCYEFSWFRQNNGCILHSFFSGEKPGGSLFLTTLNRTVESWLGAIVAWEYFLRKLPIGTHEWQKFQTPQEIEKILKAGNNITT